MGWFLSSKKKGGKTAAKKKTSRKASKKQPWDPARTLRACKTLGVALSIVGLAAGWYFGQQYLIDRVGHLRGSEPLVVLDHRPAWMGDLLARQIRQEVTRHLSGNPMDNRSLALALDSLAANPWVEHIQQLEREQDGRVVVYAAYREPVALVEAQDGYHLADVQARRLPGRYTFRQLAELRLPVIVGVNEAPPYEGQPWHGQDVQAGLRLAVLLTPQPYIEQIRAIDVSNFGGRLDPKLPHLNLLTNNQGAVRWGRAPGDERFYEPKAEKKLQLLASVYRRFGAIDAGGQIVDVFSDTALIHPTQEVRYTASSE